MTVTDVAAFEDGGPAMRMSCNNVVTGVAFLGALGAALDARADVRIVESNVAQIKEGAVLPDNARLIIPEGGKLKVFIVPAKEMKVIVGPFQGRAADYNTPSEGTGTNLPAREQRPFGGARETKD